MVRAILAGTKTQTRRLVKPEHLRTSEPATRVLDTLPERFMKDAATLCPYCVVGDRLWVKETFCPVVRPINDGRAYEAAGYVYRATHDGTGYDGSWKPSIFCTRAASRITLEVNAVRIERLNDISESDAIAEGIEQVDHAGEKFWKNYQFKTAHPRRGVSITDAEHRTVGFRDPRDSYRSLWAAINGPESVTANPWVWVLTFRRE